MPMYAYRCQVCGHNFEVKQGFHDNPLTDCPNCHTPGSVMRVIQPAGVVFKGSGWYVTDSRSSRENLAVKAKPGAHESSSGKVDTSTAHPATPEKKEKPTTSE